MSITPDPKRHKSRSVEPQKTKKDIHQTAMDKFGGPAPTRHRPPRQTRVMKAKTPQESLDYKNSHMATRVVDHTPLDAAFLMLVIILLLAGLVMVFSASYAEGIDDYGDAAHYFKQQAFFACLGLAGMLFFTFLPDYYALKGWTKVLMIGSILLLLLVPFIGVKVNGARRWLRIAGIRFQPSEFAKVAAIFMMAKWCEEKRTKMNRFWVSLKGMIVSCGPILLLLAFQPHVSCMILIGATVFVMVYVGGMNNKVFWSAAVLGLGGLGLFIKFGSQIPVDYIRNRWYAWKDPASVAQTTGYQTLQSLMALGSGSIFGVGFGKSRQKQLFLPESQNDYILSIIGEELGMIGIIIVLVLFGLLIWRGIAIAHKARDRFGFMLAVGIMAKVALQVVLNLAVVTNAIPVTGIALPFFSYGGTALAVQLCEMGVVLNISRQARLDETKVK